MELRVAKLLKYLLYSVLGLFLLAVLVVGFYIYMIYGTHASDEGSTWTACENYDEAQGKYQKITITRIEDGKRVSYAGTQRDCL